MVTIAEFTAPPLQADPDEIEHFLQDYLQDDIHLVAIIPDAQTADGRWFGADITAAATWAIEQNEGGAGIYFSPNRVRAGLHKKSTKADVLAARFAHVDIDPPKDGSAWDPGAAARELEDLELPPSFVLFSGGGLQAFWRLGTNVPDREPVEAINRGIRDHFGADSSWNIDRVMRLPGTINFPN